MVVNLPSLKRRISPPPLTTARKPRSVGLSRTQSAATTTADIEAGVNTVDDHVNFWFEALNNVTRPQCDGLLNVHQYRSLFERNQNASGHHFVVHQHDHPVSGVHYDLRLQISPSSSVSFAIPYGLVGNPNSIRPNRMAIETRVHNLWNHLIESASHASGSMLIWDTGEYEIMPRPDKNKKRLTDDESSQASSTQADQREPSEPEKLAAAFQSRHMHIRLHGTRLPKGYTIAMRLPRHEYRTDQPRAAKRRRKVQEPKPVHPPPMTDSDSGDSLSGTATPAGGSESTTLHQAAAASDDEARGKKETDMIRRNNAYPGALNSIGSVHQRHWFLSLDREASGFVKQRVGPEAGRWVCQEDTDGQPRGFEPFFVMGREVEISVVTGRKAEDVMRDAGVQEYRGRKMWRPITR